MNTYESEDVTREFLSRLPDLAGDSRRSERTRQRCRAMLGRQQRGRERVRSGVARAQSLLRPVAVGAFCAFCVVYVGALVAAAVLLQVPLG